MNKLFGFLFTPIHYLFFFLLLLIFHVVQVIAFNFFGEKAHKRSVDLLNFFLLQNFRTIGSRIKFINNYSLPVGQTIIAISNHQSMYDMPMIIWYLRKINLKFVSKKELAKGIPSISYNLRHSGAALIDRNDKAQALAEIEKLGKLIQEKKLSALIFPEGTRSKTGILKPFSIGGISTLLKEAPDALILPLVINNSWKIFRYGQFPLSFGEKISLEVLEPFSSKNLTALEVIAKAEEQIKGKLK